MESETEMVMKRIRRWLGLIHSLFSSQVVSLSAIMYQYRSFLNLSAKTVHSTYYLHLHTVDIDMSRFSVSQKPTFSFTLHPMKSFFSFLSSSLHLLFFLYLSLYFYFYFSLLFSLFSRIFLPYTLYFFSLLGIFLFNFPVYFVCSISFHFCSIFFLFLFLFSFCSIPYLGLLYGICDISSMSMSMSMSIFDVYL